MSDLLLPRPGVDAATVSAWLNDAELALWRAHTCKDIHVTIRAQIAFRPEDFRPDGRVKPPGQRAYRRRRTPETEARLTAASALMDSVGCISVADLLREIASLRRQLHEAQT